MRTVIKRPQTAYISGLNLGQMWTVLAPGQGPAHARISSHRHMGISFLCFFARACGRPTHEANDDCSAEELDLPASNCTLVCFHCSLGE